MKSILAIPALSLVVASSLTLAANPVHARTVAVSIESPEFGFRIGTAPPRVAAHPVYAQPVYVPVHAYPPPPILLPSGLYSPPPRLIVPMHYGPHLRHRHRHHGHHHHSHRHWHVERDDWREQGNRRHERDDHHRGREIRGVDYHFKAAPRGRDGD